MKPGLHAAVVGIALCAAGCYQSHERPADAGIPLEGPRIRPVDLVVPGGASQPDGFFDRLLGVDCDFRLAEDGVLRCLPRDAVGVGFEDPECRRPVLVVGSSTTDASCRLAQYADRAGCDRASALYRATPGTRAVARVFTDMFGECRERPTTTGWLVADVEHVEPSTFVAATRAPIPPGAGVVRESIVTEEGATYTTGAVWDRDRDVGCAVVAGAGLGDGRAVCAAVDAWLPVHRGGERCAELFTRSFGGCFSPAPGARVAGIEFDGCGRGWQGVYEVGPSYSADAIGAARCGHYADFDGWSVEPVSPDSVAALEVRRLGSGRLHPIAYASPGGEAFRAGPVFWDDALGRRCWPQLVGGELRCVPDTALLVGDGRPLASTDGECRIPALTMPERLDCEEGGFYAFDLDGCGRDGWTAVYAFGELADRWYSFETGHCRAVAGMPGEQVRLLEEVDLVRLERVVR